MLPILLPIQVDMMMSEVEWLVNELGPRPYRSKAAQLASIGIENRLKKAGWKPQTVQLSGNIVACRGKGKRLFLAHTDTVAESPGAIDNAAGVVTLLTLARHSKATDLCLAFPVGEEIGMLGSTQMARFVHKWHPNPKDLDTVVSLDLTGQGDLSITGLGPNWGTSNLQWLYSAAQPRSEYGYQVFSRMVPSMERSDHGPFASAGYMSMHLLGRNQDGIFPYYHQPEDDKVSTKALEETVQTLERIANAPDAPEASSRWLPGLVIGSFVLPHWMIWLLIISGIISGGIEYKHWKSSLFDFLKSVLFLIPISLLVYLFCKTGLFPSSIPEQSAAKVMGMPATGWWSGALAASVLSLGLFFGLRWKFTAHGSAPLLCGIATLILTIAEPTLALPMALAALLSRMWGPLAVVGGLYWIQPAILRELSFHGILPPELWFLLFALILPATGRAKPINEDEHSS